RHAHPRLGGHGGESGVLALVRGQLRGLRGEQDRAVGPGSGEAEPCGIPQAHPGLIVRLHVAIPLRWSDFDAYAHVNNAEMFRLLEEARIQAFWPPDAGSDFGSADVPATAVLDGRPGAETMTLIARQE